MLKRLTDVRRMFKCSIEFVITEEEKKTKKQALKRKWVKLVLCFNILLKALQAPCTGDQGSKFEDSSIALAPHPTKRKGV
jgi:hypothetical protein